MPHQRPAFKLFPKSRATIRKSVPRAFILRLLVLFIIFISFLTLLSRFLLSSPSLFLNPFSHPIRQSNITLWHPNPRCQGTFHTGPAKNSPSGFPYAVLRDAVLDRRPSSKRVLGEHDVHGVVRIVLYVTMHLSARLSREDASMEVEGAQVGGDVEYVTHVTKFLVPHQGMRYQPGQKDRFGREITEWQVGVRLQPRGDAAGVAQAMEGGKRMKIKLQVTRHDEERMEWQLSMGLNCVMGWTVAGVEGRGVCGAEGKGAEGGILFGGSALYGEKKRKRKHFREIANFAARGLLGEVKYDMVVMGVVTDFSKDDMYFKCGKDDWRCLDALEEENANRLRDVAGTVQEEMEAIGVPVELLSRVVLVPSCRLGSDASATERGDPCYKSKRYGQYYSSFFTYTMLAPFFKWAVSHDMDEFLASVPSSPKPAGRADQILDEADASFGESQGHVVFQWLNFRVESAEHSRALSKELITGKKLMLINRQNPNKEAQCYEQTRDDTAKSAVRCDIGLGFTIHHPVIAVEGQRMEVVQGNRVCRGLRTWHARLGEVKWARVADCDYKPQA